MRRHTTAGDRDAQRSQTCQLPDGGGNGALESVVGEIPTGVQHDAIHGSSQCVAAGDSDTHPSQPCQQPDLNKQKKRGDVRLSAIRFRGHRVREGAGEIISREAPACGSTL